MNVFPHPRLLRALALWTAAGVVVVALPWLWPVATVALAILAALVVWDLLLLRRQAPLDLERHLAERTFAGRATDVTLALRNPGALPVEAEVSEDVPSWMLATSPDFTGIPVDPGSTTTLRYTVAPARHGDARFGAAIVLERSPLGFLRRRRRHGDGQVARVYPDVSRYLRPEALNPKLVFAAIGVRPKRQRGEGMEFESLRDWVPGDDPRHVSWAASARRGRPVTRLTQHEKHHTIYVAVDTSRLMASLAGGRAKLDFAIDAALALAYGALVSGDRLGMATFSDVVQGVLAPRSHKRELGRFVDFLRQARPRLVEASYAALATSLAAHQRQRALVIILTDFVDVDGPTFTAPLAALAKRHRVLLVALRDPIYQQLDGGESSLGLYRRLVLNDLLRSREEALLVLRRGGIQTVDLPPEQITAAVLNRYVALRGE